MLELTQFENVQAKLLSDGNKRKLSCAMTLLVKPSIEFLDEPCKDFDPITRRAIKKMTQELKKMDLMGEKMRHKISLKITLLSHERYSSEREREMRGRCKR